MLLQKLAAQVCQEVSQMAWCCIWLEVRLGAAYSDAATLTRHDPFPWGGRSAKRRAAIEELVTDFVIRTDQVTTG
jgi:hypothetical protein